MTKARRSSARLVQTAVLAAAASLGGSPHLAAAPDPHLSVVLDWWTAAVMHHTPGRIDDAAVATWTSTPADWPVIRDHLHEFLSYLDGADYHHAKDDHLIVASAALALAPLSSTEFIERAATLHADAVIFDPRPPAPATADEVAAVRRGHAKAEGDAPALFFTTTDGEYLNAKIENPNWLLARALLDELPPGQPSQTFATKWYHAATAYLLSRGDFGEAEAALDHATAIMPESAQALFDLGCVAETLGMNVFQEVIVEDPLLGGPPHTPSAKERDRQAASLFERALALDPHLPEARVRWARILELDRRWADATSQIGMAVTDQPDRAVAFYAHLFGARAANGLHDAATAEAHLAQALTLFPQAESAMMEASETALVQNDPDLAKSRLLPLTSRRDDTPDTDPWLQYPLGPGRLPAPHLQALWHAAPSSVR